jgi:Flp pilus assembly protein TadD
MNGGISLPPVRRAINRTNFGISLLAVRDYKGAEEQARRAQELEPDNPEIKRFLDAVVNYKQSIAPHRP